MLGFKPFATLSYSSSGKNFGQRLLKWAHHFLVRSNICELFQRLEELWPYLFAVRDPVYGRIFESSV